MDLAPQPGAVTVLLGATQAGKTSLMRIMAGLDTPSTGRVRVDGQDVTGLPVRQRNVAMVYQQFINYPSMTVYDNIASPLRLGPARGRDRPPGAGPGRAPAHRGLPRAPAGRALRRPAAARRAGPGPGQGAR
jgi:glycerol transport system ATP-binding protein